MAYLDVIDVSKTFDREPALTDVSLHIHRGEIVCLLGPSGCGKTTLLRIICGLERADRGKVLFDGKDTGDVAPHLRRFGMMFQDFALFPHKNVLENVLYGLEMMGMSRRRRLRRAMEVLQLVGLEEHARRNIADLSGGERQRVALARSLAPNPLLLMLDEPLGSLDRELRERLTVELRRILKQVGMTGIYVTHDQSEAFTVGDTVVILHRGQVQQAGPPEQLYHRPANLMVAQFLGFRNFLDATVVAEDRVQTELGDFQPRTGGLKSGTKVSLLVRPEAAQAVVNGDETRGRRLAISGRLREARFQGPVYRIILVSEKGTELVFQLPAVNVSTLSEGQNLDLELDPRACSII